MTYEPQSSSDPTPHSSHRPPAGDAGSMFISAAIFGFFGFIQFNGHNTLLLFELVKWTLQGAAIGFAVSGVLAMMRLPLAGWLYLIIGGFTAIAFAVLGVWHLLDPNVGNMNGIILIAFGIWNGSSTYRAISGRDRY